MERKLAAILAADVVGYARLMGEDEVGTLERLKAHRRDLIDPTIAARRGRIVKLMGDGALVEFASVVDAVSCAVEIQRGMTARNADVPQGQRIEFRIGINIGDVIVEGSDIYGDGVNVAARLEALAEPGGVWVSRVVRDQVRDKLALAFEDMGEREVKNIARPIKAHRVHFEGGEPAEIKASETGALSKTALSRRVLPRVRWLALAAVLVLVAVAGGWYALRPSARDAGASSERTTIAVLPFTNMSGDPAQDYFSDGITEEILTALARSRTLLVTARNSSFTYKGKAADVKEVGRTLGVRYVVEGSVQKTADTVRVTAQLIDAQTGSHVWAEKFDRPLKDILAVQDEITMAIAAQLGSRVQKAEVDAILRKGQVDLGAYDYYLRGRALRQTSRKAPTLESRALFEKAIELDPKFASPYAELAFTYYLEVSLRWDPANREQAILKGVNLVETALAIDESLPFAHLTRGDLYIRQHEFDQAMVWVQQAIRLNPSDPDGYAALANIYAFLNRSGEALPLVEKAIALDPLYPPIFDMYQGRAYTLAGRFTEAIPHLQHCIGRAPDYWPCHAYLASSYAHMGNMDLAHQELAEMRRYYPVKSLRQYRDEGDFQPGPETDRVYKGLLLAGLPEE